MRGDVSFEVDGKEYRARLTLGAIEEVSEVDPAPTVIYSALASNIYTVKELRCVLDAAFRASKVDLTSDALVEALGMREAHLIALRLMREFYRDDAGNAEAVAE